MDKYKIANLNVLMNCKYPRITLQANKYKEDFSGSADISLELSDDFYQARLKENPHLTIDEIEYIYLGSLFYNKILDFNGFLLHSSAIAMDNNAYLFSADSGVGKSTHTQNWINYFGEDKVTYINDDKPVIRKINGEFYCCGTPFSGKTNLSSNLCVPIKAIVFIKRGKDNSIQEIDSKTAIDLIFSQTLYKLDQNKVIRLLELLDELLRKVKVYELTCNMDVESAKVAYEYLNKE